MTTADLQRLYDASYGQCMAARGNTVAATSGGPRFPSDSLQAATDLTDPDSMAARQAVQDVVASSQRNCAGERIVVTVTDAPISPSTKARLVALSTPYGGNCFGQPGQNSYVVARQGVGWSRLLSAEPGSIDVLPGTHRGYRDLRMNSLGLCTYTYAWNGSRYTQTGSDQCATAAPPGYLDAGHQEPAAVARFLAQLAEPFGPVDDGDAWRRREAAAPVQPEVFNLLRRRSRVQTLAPPAR